MRRREALTLVAGACGASTIRCGGGGPTGPSSVPATGGIPVLAHYAGWWTVPGQWALASSIPRRSDGPGITGYTSANPSIIAAHNTEMQANGIWPMVSWWGPHEYAGDAFLDAYLSQSGPPLAILYEAVGNGRLADSPKGGIHFTNPDIVAQFVAEMKHLDAKYFRGPSGGRFVRVDGRPMVFLWVSHAFKGPFEDVASQVRDFVYLVGSEFTVPAVVTEGHESVIRGLDAITSYAFYDSTRYPEEMNDTFLGDYGTALRVWREKLSVLSPQTQLLLPMNFAYDERGIPDRHGWVFRSSDAMARRYARLVAGYATNPPVPGILPMAYLTSYNEHVEGSAVEPNTDSERPDYLGIIRDTFASPAP